MKKGTFWPRVGLLGIRLGWEWLIDLSDRKVREAEKAAAAAREEIIRTPEFQKAIKDRGDMVAGNTIRAWMDNRGVRHCAVCLSTDQLRKRGPLVICPAHNALLDAATEAQLTQDVQLYGNAFARMAMDGSKIERVTPPPKAPAAPQGRAKAPGYPDPASPVDTRGGGRHG